MDSNQLTRLKMVQKDLEAGWYVFLFLSSHYALLLQVLPILYSQNCDFLVLQSSGLPWIEPKKNLSLDLSSLTDGISGVLGVSIQFYIHLSCAMNILGNVLLKEEKT